MNNQNLINALSSVIKQNGQNLITGDILQNVLITIVNALGLGYQFMGVASPATDPGTSDQRLMYIAHETGTYSHFGGTVLDGTKVAIFTFDTTWHVATIDVPTKTYIDATFVKISNLVQTLGDDPDKVISQLGMKTILEDFAKTDGWYSSLIAGSAEGLIGRSPVLSQFMFRQTKGGGAGNGTAVIQELRGNSVVWNQLVVGGDFPDGTSGSWGRNGTNLSIADNIATITSISAGIQSIYRLSQGALAGHKYLVLVDMKASVAMMAGYGFAGTYNSTDFYVTTNWQTFGAIFNGTTDDNNAYIYGRFATAGDILYARNFMLIDLTQMFNGDIPGSYTVQKFKEMYPLLYYKPNTGQILPFAGNALKSTGVNQWDEEWEEGYIETNGSEASYGTTMRSKNYDSCVPGSVYYCYCGSSGHVFIAWYDASKTFIIRQTITNNTQTAPSNARYFKLCTNSDYGAIYKNDIQIAIYDATNPECMTYHPYEEHTLAFPGFTSMTGKVNGQGASEVMFGEAGMGKAGAAYNVLFVDQDGWCRRGQKRLVIVDLGDLNWVYDSDANIFYVMLTGAKTNDDNTVANIICPNYTAASANAVYYGQDKTVGIWSSVGGSVIIRDTAYSDAAAFKAAMDGVYLVYELATPVDYVLDEPFYLGYPVNSLGTEQIIPENTDEPYTAPSNFNTLYPMDAVGTIENLGKNFIKKSSMENILNAMVAAGKIASYTLTYNAANDDYDCTIS